MGKKQFDKPSKYTNRIFKKAFGGKKGKQLQKDVVSYIQKTNPALTGSGTTAAKITDSQLGNLLQEAIGPKQQAQVNQALSSQKGAAAAQADVSRAVAQAQSAYSGAPASSASKSASNAPASSALGGQGLSVSKAPVSSASNAPVSSVSKAPTSSASNVGSATAAGPTPPMLRHKQGEKGKFLSGKKVKREQSTERQVADAQVAAAQGAGGGFGAPPSGNMGFEMAGPGSSYSLSGGPRPGPRPGGSMSPGSFNLFGPGVGAPTPGGIPGAVGAAQGLGNKTAMAQGSSLPYLNQAVMRGLQGNFFNMDPYRQQALRNMNRETRPDIANTFANLGTANSSDTIGALVNARRDVEMGLAQQGAGMNFQAQNALVNQGGFGNYLSSIGQPFNTMGQNVGLGVQGLNAANSLVNSSATGYGTAQNLANLNIQGLGIIPSTFNTATQGVNALNQSDLASRQAELSQTAGSGQLFPSFLSQPMEQGSQIASRGRIGAEV